MWHWNSTSCMVWFWRPAGWVTLTCCCLSENCKLLYRWTCPLYASCLCCDNGTLDDFVLNTGNPFIQLPHIIKSGNICTYMYKYTVVVVRHSCDIDMTLLAAVTSNWQRRFQIQARPPVSSGFFAECNDICICSSYWVGIKIQLLNI